MEVLDENVLIYLKNLCLKNKAGQYCFEVEEIVQGKIREDEYHRKLAEQCFYAYNTTGQYIPSCRTLLTDLTKYLGCCYSDSAYIPDLFNPLFDVCKMSIPKRCSQ